MKIIFHGAAREVGKSCIELKTNKGRYLFDAGVKFIQGGVEYPKFLDKIFGIDAVFISHAHMDHSGALPMLEHKRLNCPIYMTSMTKGISDFLLEDAYHLDKLRNIHPAYIERDIKKAQKDTHLVKFDKLYETKKKDIKFSFINSGHIPGSASILMDIEGKKVVYSADVNTDDTMLMEPSNIQSLRDVDVFITETTYGDRYHPDLNKTREDFLYCVKKGLEKGGSILLPVFSVGRAQEILILLSKLDYDCEIYIDGLAKKISEFILNPNVSSKYIDNLDILEYMYKKARKVFPKEREVIARKKGVIILSSSGMMQGGPVMTYAKHIIHKKENTIILSGYQGNGTNGRSIFEDRTFYNNHQRHHVICDVKKFDFSAHLGRDDIQRVLKSVKPKVVILNHGDISAMQSMELWIKEHLKDVKVLVPEIGEELEF